ASLTGHSAPVSAAAFSRDGKTLATGSFDKSVKLWDVAGRKQKTNLIPDEFNPAANEVILSLAYSPDGRILATGGWSPTVKLRDVHNGQLLATLKEHAEAVSAVAFSPDGKTLATASYDKTVKLWDVADLLNPKSEIRLPKSGNENRFGFWI